MIRFVSSFILLLANMHDTPGEIISNITNNTKGCTISDINYDFDRHSGSDSSVFSKHHWIKIGIIAHPRDEQKSIDGMGMLYYEYSVEDGRILKSVEGFSFHDSIPAGSIETYTMQKLTVFGTLEDIYDLEMISLNCSVSS